MRKALFRFLLILNFSATLFAMESPKEFSIKIIVGGEVNKPSLERDFQKMPAMPAMPGCKYEFVEQLLDETLLNIASDAYKYILYVIDYSKFIKFPNSQDKMLPILRGVTERFPKGAFPVNILLTNVNISPNGFAREQVRNYFTEREVALFMNNIFAVPKAFEDSENMSRDELVELQMLKYNMAMWSK